MKEANIVLILVLMEYGLRQRPIRPSGLNGSGLNPCFNGIWSATAQEGYSWAMAKSSLNPCFNGIWSATVLAIMAKPYL